MNRNVFRRHLWLLIVAVLFTRPVAAIGVENLLGNAEFEAPLESGWERRTPDDLTRTLYRQTEAGRDGSAVAVLENVQSSYTRLRQGHDRSITVAPGALLQLSAWVRSELDERGQITLQIYCMDQKDRILAQPTSAPVSGSFDWTQRTALVVVPEGTAYVMAYLQVKDGVGKSKTGRSRNRCRQVFVSWSTRQSPLDSKLAR